MFFCIKWDNKVKILEIHPAKSVTHAAELKKMLPDIDIDNL